MWAEPRSARLLDALRGGVHLSRSSSTIPPSTRRSTRTCSTTKVSEDLSAAGGGRENRLRARSRPARSDRTGGFGEECQARPRRAANGNRAETSEDLTPSQAKALRSATSRKPHDSQQRRPERRIAAAIADAQDRGPRHCESGLTHNERRARRRQCQRATRR